MNKRNVSQFPLRYFLIAGLSVLCLFSAAFDADALVVTNRSGSEVGQYRNSYALLIGVSDYSSSWPDLPGVVEDIAEIGKTLEGLGFTVVETLNPDQAALNKSLANFITSYGQEKANRLLIYFAGHCYHLAPKYGADEMDYLVPSDAPNPDDSIVKFRESALSLYFVNVMIEHIQSNHALFLFDGCGGKTPILGLRKEEREEKEITEKTFNPVRQVFFFEKSGTTKPGLDKSFVRKQLVKALSGEGDLNGDGFVTSSELAEFLRSLSVAGKIKFLYGKLKNPLGEAGDLIIPLHLPPETKKTDSEMQAASARNSPPSIETEARAATEIFSPPASLGGMASLYLNRIEPESPDDITKHIGTFWPPGEAKRAAISGINEETFNVGGDDREKLWQKLSIKKPALAEIQASAVTALTTPPTLSINTPEPKTESAANLPENRWVIKAEGAALDMKSGLMWMTRDFRNLEGRAPRNWEEAVAWVEKTNARGLAGYKDWRAPTIAELKSIYNFEGDTWDPNRDKRSGYPEIFAAGGGYWYWSNEEHDANQAWGFGFFSGVAKTARKKDSYAFSSIRLVRSDNAPTAKIATSK